MLLARQHSHITAEDILSEATNVRGDDDGVCRFGLAVCSIVLGWFRSCFWVGLCEENGMAACPP